MHLEVLLYFYYWYFKSSLNKTDVLHCKWVPIFVTDLSVPINLLQPSGHYMYRQFNIHKLYVLPKQYIYVFCVDLRTNGDYFPIQH
jgi:hypothetical protein